MALTFTHEKLGALRTVTATWTSDSSGDATATTTEVVSGTLVKAITNPTDGPTANYDIVITDDQSFNVLTNTDDDLLNRHTTTTEEVYFLVLDKAGTPLAQSIQPVTNSVLTFTVSNAGATKSGVVILFYRNA
jgi:hypothetical protein